MPQRSEKSTRDLTRSEARDEATHLIDCARTALRRGEWATATAQATVALALRSLHS
jgi:hypothetical protein